MNRPFVLSLLLAVVCASAFAAGGRANKKQPNINDFKQRFRLEQLRRDLPQIRNFSDSVQAFQVNVSVGNSFGTIDNPILFILQFALTQAYNYLPVRQPYLSIKTVFYFEKHNYYPSVYEFKDFLTEKSNVYIESFENTCSANASQKIVCAKTLSPLLKILLLNSTQILEFLKFDPKVTTRGMPGICSLVLFYAKACPHSILGVPHYLFLHRIFPQIRMVAVDTVSEQRFNLVFNVIGTPTLLLFHNGIPAAKFDKPSFTVYELTKFIVKWTDLIPGQLTELTESDLMSFVEPTQINSVLLFSWAVFIFWAIYYKWYLYIKRFFKSIINFFMALVGPHRPHND